MKTLYLECGMGAAGDMLMAALAGLLPDPDGFVAELNALGIPGVRVKRLAAESCGIAGTRMEVTVNGEEEESRDWHAHPHAHGELEHSHGHSHPHGHDHDHGEHRDSENGQGHACDAAHPHAHPHGHEDDGHSHDHPFGDGHHGHGGQFRLHGGHPCGHGHGHHAHATREDALAVIEKLPVSENVRRHAAEVYALLAEAEAEAHGRPVNEVHFHEVGNMDAVADIVGVCLLMEKLSPERVVVSPVRTGHGFVRCAHGLLPVPAPAAANLLRGMPVFAGDIPGELCTPTGAALLKHFASEFGPMPAMAVERIGIGMGKKRFGNVANCLRAFWGESGEAEGPNERVWELSCNLDDMTGEDIAFAAERLLEEGALDVFSQPILMKKGRPATMLTCLCREAEKNRFAKLMLRYTATFGVRAKLCERFALNREQVVQATKYGDIAVKHGFGYGVDKHKPEYEDVKHAAMAFGVAPEQVRRELKPD